VAGFKGKIWWFYSGFSCCHGMIKQQQESMSLEKSHIMVKLTNERGIVSGFPEGG
jgi:hypothetical protein